MQGGSEGLTAPATPPLPPPMKTMSYFSCAGFVTGGILATEVAEDSARVICSVCENGVDDGTKTESAYLEEAARCNGGMGEGGGAEDDR